MSLSRSAGRWTPSTLIALCALSTGLGAQEPAERNVPERSNRESITLQVTNDHWQDINVFLVKAGNRMRLGTVTSFRTVEIELPAWASATADVQFLATPIGSSVRLTTDRLTMWPGDLVVWTLRNNLNMSTLSVFGT